KTWSEPSLRGGSTYRVRVSGGGGRDRDVDAGGATGDFAVAENDARRDRHGVATFGETVFAVRVGHHRQRHVLGHDTVRGGVHVLSERFDAALLSSDAGLQQVRDENRGEDADDRDDDQ